jgi:hypothetical protein
MKNKVIFQQALYETSSPCALLFRSFLVNMEKLCESSQFNKPKTP